MGAEDPVLSGFFRPPPTEGTALQAEVDISVMKTNPLSISLQPLLNYHRDILSSLVLKFQERPSVMDLIQKFC